MISQWHIYVNYKNINFISQWRTQICTGNLTSIRLWHIMLTTRISHLDQWHTCIYVNYEHWESRLDQSMIYYVNDKNITPWSIDDIYDNDKNNIFMSQRHTLIYAGISPRLVNDMRMLTKRTTPLSINDIHTFTPGVTHQSVNNLDLYVYLHRSQAYFLNYEYLFITLHCICLNK